MGKLESYAELKANAPNGYVINCTIVGREGDNPLPGGVPRMDGYHVVPSEDVQAREEVIVAAMALCSKTKLGGGLVVGATTDEVFLLIDALRGTLAGVRRW